MPATVEMGLEGSISSGFKNTVSYYTGVVTADPYNRYESVFTTAEVAEIIGISTAALTNRLLRGSIPDAILYKGNRRYFYKGQVILLVKAFHLSTRLRGNGDDPHVGFGRSALIGELKKAWVNPAGDLPIYNDDRYFSDEQRAEIEALIVSMMLKDEYI